MDIKRIITAICIIFLCVICTNHSSGQSKSYDPEKEISFEMNSASDMIHIPADYNWVRYYRLEVPHSPMVNNMIDARDANFRFFMGVDELRNLCEKKSGKLPLKAKIYRGNHQYPFHITNLIVRFKLNGYVEFNAFGYIFEK